MSNLSLNAFAEGSSGRVIRSALLHVVTCALLSGALPALAADGRFEVVNANSRLEDNRWVVDAQADLELSDEAIEALQNGVTLQLEFQYEVSQSISFWPDRVIATSRQLIELQYLSLSQRYVVRWSDTDEQVSYATLYSALRYMGRVRDRELVVNPSDGSDNYWAGIRVVLASDNLPGPLQMIAFWRGDFSLESDWYRWKLN